MEEERRSAGAAGAEGASRYSVPQAARILGISERAVRKRIEHGSMRAEREAGRWVVYLSTVKQVAEVEASAVEPEEPAPVVDTSTGLVEQLLQRLDHRERRIEELAGQLGYLQRGVQEKDEQLRLLAAPSSSAEGGENQIEPDRVSSPATKQPGRWHRLVRRAKYGPQR